MSAMTGALLGNPVVVTVVGRARSRTVPGTVIAYRGRDRFVVSWRSFGEVRAVVDETGRGRGVRVRIVRAGESEGTDEQQQ